MHGITVACLIRDKGNPNFGLPLFFKLAKKVNSFLLIVFTLRLLNIGPA